MERIKSAKLLHQDGSKEKITAPINGKLFRKFVGGKTIIVSEGWFGGKREIIPPADTKIRFKLRN